MNASSSLKRRRLVSAAIFGFTGVALGAFGAHQLEGVFAANGLRHVWETAVLYQFIHALALFFLAQEEEAPCWIGAAFSGGIVLFSGSLYLLAVTGVHWLGAVTPLGGLAFLAGWAGLGVCGWKRRP